MNRVMWLKKIISLNLIHTTLISSHSIESLVSVWPTQNNDMSDIFFTYFFSIKLRLRSKLFLVNSINKIR